MKKTGKKPEDLPIENTVPQELVKVDGGQIRVTFQKVGDMVMDQAGRIQTKVEIAQARQDAVDARNFELQNNPALMREHMRDKMMIEAYTVGMVFVRIGGAMLIYECGNYLSQNGNFIARWTGRTFKLAALAAMVAAPFMSDY